MEPEKSMPTLVLRRNIQLSGLKAGTPLVQEWPFLDLATDQIRMLDTSRQAIRTKTKLIEVTVESEIALSLNH